MKKLLVFLFLSAIIIQPLFSSNGHENAGEETTLVAGHNANSHEDNMVEEKNTLTVDLKFQKQSYRLNEPIEVNILIINNTKEPQSVMVSPLVYESFFFELKTPKNEIIPLLNSFQIELKNNASAGGDYRAFTLLPSESFSRVIDITRWFDIQDAGYYYVKGFFYPDPDKKSEMIDSFDFKILIKPPLLIEKAIKEEEHTKETVMKQVKLLPPYDVVADLLNAKMLKDWPRFMTHIDAERLITAFHDYASAYENARTGKYKFEILEDFKRYLTVHWQDRIKSYKVTETQIKDDQAIVVSDVDFKVKTFEYSMRYTFSLYKNHLNEWLVYDYTALKTK